VGRKNLKKKLCGGPLTIGLRERALLEREKITAATRESEGEKQWTGTLGHEPRVKPPVGEEGTKRPTKGGGLKILE